MHAYCMTFQSTATKSPQVTKEWSGYEGVELKGVGAKGNHPHFWPVALHLMSVGCCLAPAIQHAKATISFTTSKSESPSLVKAHLSSPLLYLSALLYRICLAYLGSDTITNDLGPKLQQHTAQHSMTQHSTA